MVIVTGPVSDRGEQHQRRKLFACATPRLLAGESHPAQPPSLTLRPATNTGHRERSTKAEGMMANKRKARWV